MSYQTIQIPIKKTSIGSILEDVIRLALPNLLCLLTTACQNIPAKIPIKVQTTVSHDASTPKAAPQKNTELSRTIESDIATSPSQYELTAAEKPYNRAGLSNTASEPEYNDLWARIRAGMALPSLSDSPVSNLVKIHIEW